MKKVVLLTLVALLAVACGTSLDIKTNEQGDTIIEAAVPEDVVNTLLRQAVDSGDTQNDLLTTITSIDMKPGLITVTGTRAMPDGTEAPGSFDLALGTQDGRLTASVSNVQISGYDFTEEQIAQLNQRIAQSLSTSASDSDGARIDTVTITDNALQFVIILNRQQ